MDFFQSLFFNDVVLTFDGFSLDALGDAALVAGMGAGAQRGLILVAGGLVVLSVVILIFQSVDGGFEAAVFSLVVLNRTLNGVLVLNAHHFLTLGLLHEVVELAAGLLGTWHVAPHSLHM